MKVMKEPLTLDDASLGPESETREELAWKLQSYEEQIKQLSEENKELRKRGGSPSKGERKETREEEELSLEQQLSDKAVINTEVSRAADSGIMDSDTASSLSEALQDCNSVRDVIKTLFSHGSAQVDKKMKERELQLERQNTKVEHLKSQIDVMALTLAESKGYADKLSMLVGQYDAGNSALSLAVKYTEMALEVSEVLNLLSDSEQNVLLANCNKAGPDTKLASGTGKVTIERKRAMNNRRQVEMRAKSLLQKLEKTLEDPSGVWETMSNSTHTSKHSNGASSVGSHSSAAEIEISQSEILRFKEYKEQLKGHKNALKATIIDLDTSILQPDSDVPKTNSKTDLRLDLEHAVMLQELNCAKEERAEMKAMAYLAQQELRTLELRLEAAKLQEQGFKTQMSYYKTEWREELRKRRRLAKEVKARNTGEPNPEEFTLEMELSEALKREKKLKVKMAELTETIERLARNAEMRHTQQGTYISDLKRTNEALTSAYDKSKKKHALSLKKLEAQITQLVAQHERETKHSADQSKHEELANNRLSYFEERSCSSFGSQGHGEETEL